MVYYKLVLDDRREKKDELYPIIVRVINDRKNTSFNSGIRVKPNQWDSNAQLINKIHPNYQILNRTLSEYYLKVQKHIHNLIDNGDFSFEALRMSLTERPIVQIAELGFQTFSQQVIKEMVEEKRSGNAIVYQTAVNRLINYCNNQDIKFSEIDYNFLNAFKHEMLVKGAKINTIGNYFRSIRALYNKAIKARIVDRACYPFYEISIKQERTAKRAVMIKDIKELVGLELKSYTPAWHARNYFLLSFSLIGISFTDLAYLKPENIVKGRIEFKRRKTHKRYSIKLTSYAKSLFDIYQNASQTYLLPILPFKIIEDSFESKKRITQALRITNKYLKRLGIDCGLSSPLTTYVARHTWATTAKRLGYSNELIAEAMGHEYGNKITNIYLDNFEQSVIDELNDKVISTIVKKDPA